MQIGDIYINKIYKNKIKIRNIDNNDGQIFILYEDSFGPDKFNVMTSNDLKSDYRKLGDTNVKHYKKNI